MSVAAVGIVVVVVVVVVVIVDMKMSVLCRRDHCLHAIKTMTIVIVMDRQQETGGWMDGWMDESIDCSKRWSISVSLVARCCPRCDRLLLLFVRFHVSLRLSVSPCPHTHTHFSLSRSISLHLAVSTCVFLCDGAPEKIAKPSTVRTSRDVLLEMRIWLWNYPGAIHGGLSRSSVVAATIGLSTLHVGEKNRVPIPTYLPTYLSFHFLKHSFPTKVQSLFDFIGMIHRLVSHHRFYLAHQSLHIINRQEPLVYRKTLMTPAGTLDAQFATATNAHVTATPPATVAH